MEHGHDPLPPPPYSETDIYSNAPTSPYPLLTPATSQADNASVASRPLHSTASSLDDTIFTPTGSVGDDIDIASASSAAAYFESRPPQNQVVAPAVIHTITITSSTEPSDLPYPEAWQVKDVTEQDWATFINYLIPDHAFGVNNDVAERKLRAELIDSRMHSLNLGAEDRSRTNMNEVDAQLDPLRQPQSPGSLDRLNRVQATISEWNEGFFKPRGIQITTIDLDAEIAAGEDGNRMPDSYIPYDHELLPNSDNRRDQRGLFGRFRSFSGIESNAQGFRMGPIVANNEGFRIGNGLFADNSGFRLGRMLVADQNGFRLGGARGFQADSHGVSLAGRSFGRRDFHGYGRGRGHRGGRGRTHSRGRHHSHRRRERSSSTSSFSSSSSSSSSESESSVGSLPDYKDIKDQQLPIVKQSLLEWLNHPDQPVTKEAVRNMKRTMKAAKKSPSKAPDEDLKALRNEIRDLMKQLKDGKKAQKKQRKEAKRERRAARKALKKERRNARKEARRARRQEKEFGPGPEVGAGPFSSRFPGSPQVFGQMLPPMPTPVNSLPPPMPTPANSLPPPMPTPPMAPGGFPFGRAASVPFLKGPPFGRGPPGMAAMHGGWPFTQNLPYAPGRISVPQEMQYPTPVSRGAEQLHSQARQMEENAQTREDKALELRTSASRNVGEKLKPKNEKVNLKNEKVAKELEQASRLEEEADRFRIEAHRLRAEALHLDSELARELEEHEDGGQTSGIIPH